MLRQGVQPLRLPPSSRSPRLLCFGIQSYQGTEPVSRPCTREGASDQKGRRLLF